MASPSIFAEEIAKIWPKLSLFIQEKTNGSKRQLTYLHKDRLTPVFSPDQKWEGTSANVRYVAADLVAMDSPLPLKKRSQVSKADGKLPKIGMMKKMSESDINNINIMRAQLNTIKDDDVRKQRYQQILARIANDGDACSVGIDERNEYNYLFGISNGVVLVPSDADNPNTGLGLRINYGYPEKNLFGIATKDAICGDDIQNVLNHIDADGNTVQAAMVSKTLLTNIRKSRWARELVADYQEKVYTEASTLPVPTQKSFLDAFESEYGVKFIIVDRTVTLQKNGKDYPVKPFNPNRIVFLPNATNDGSLVWGELAENQARVEGIAYSVVDQYKLISKYRVTDPALEERTKGQAMVLPVIEDVDSVYILDVTKGFELASDDATDAGAIDSKITLDGTAYKKEAVISALKGLGVTIKSNAKDETVLKAVNSLSAGDLAALMEEIKNDKFA